MFTVRDFREDMDEQLDEEVHRVRSERPLSPGASVPMELGYTTVFTGGSIH